MRGNHDVWLLGTSENNHEDEKKLKKSLAGHIDTSLVRHYDKYNENMADCLQNTRWLVVSK